MAKLWRNRKWDIIISIIIIINRLHEAQPFLRS
jgi:hypothetical protein